jgi:hypothetical protein
MQLGLYLFHAKKAEYPPDQTGHILKKKPEQGCHRKVQGNAVTLPPMAIASWPRNGKIRTKLA